MRRLALLVALAAALAAGAFAYLERMMEAGALALRDERSDTRSGYPRSSWG